jgi:hypothetical protein
LGAESLKGRNRFGKRFDAIMHAAPQVAEQSAVAWGDFGETVEHLRHGEELSAVGTFEFSTKILIFRRKIGGPLNGRF